MTRALSALRERHVLVLPDLSLAICAVTLRGKRGFWEDTALSGASLVSAQGNRMHRLVLSGFFDLSDFSTLTLTLEGYLSQNTGFSFVLCGMEFSSMQISDYTLREDHEHACGAFELELVSAEATALHAPGGTS